MIQIREFVDKASPCYSTASCVNARESLDYSRRICQDRGLSRTSGDVAAKLLRFRQLEKTFTVAVRKQREWEKGRGRERERRREALCVSSTHRLAVDEPAERGMWLRLRRSAIEPHDIADLITMFPRDGSPRDNGLVLRQGWKYVDARKIICCDKKDVMFFD